MITTIGFDTAPYAVILWQQGEALVRKTICYNAQEVETMLARHNDVNHAYHHYVPHVRYCQNTALVGVV